MCTPTAALLWAAGRPSPDPAEVRRAVAAGADLDMAADVAVAQRVSPLLERALEGAGITGDGESWARTLRRDVARCHAQSRMVLPRFGGLALQPLANAGLQPLVLKGLALVDRYPDPGLRPMGDVDLVLPPKDIDRAVEVLVAEGWDLRPTPRGRPHEIDLTHDALPGLPIDLHRELSTWRDPTKLTAEQLWEWRQPATIQGVPAFVLRPEHELLLLAIHAAKPFHTFDRMIWSVDIAMVIAAAGPGGIDWDLVGSLAAELSCRTAVAVALSHAARLGEDSPARLREPYARGAIASALQGVLSGEWPLMPRESRARAPLRYALIDRWWPRLPVLVADVMGQGAAMAPLRAVELPARGARRWWRLRTTRAKSVA